MATTEQIQMWTLGENGEPCANCGSPLAADQRYCLECGTRRGGPRIPFEQQLAAMAGSNGADSASPPAGAREPSPLGAVLGVAVLGAMLLIGVLIGRGNNDASEAPAPIVQVGEGAQTADSGSGSSETVSAGGEVASDWPQGETGWTVELGTLPKDTSAADVEAAKQDAEGKGAPDVGVLDSDQYASLPDGNYVIYSGVYGSESDAQDALADLEADFPDAQVIEVSDQEASSGDTGSSSGGGLVGGGAPTDAPVEATTEDLEALEDVTGQEYQDQLEALPDTIVTPGEEAEQDNEEPGQGAVDGPQDFE